MKTALVISYRGTAYSGWQVQSNAVSVQKTLQNAIEGVLGSPVMLSGCSRTDSGVHANEFYCHIDRLSGIDNEKFPLAVNQRLPKDICIKRAFDAPDDFHSRYSAAGKEYIYLIWNSRVRNVFYGDTAYKYPKYIDIDVVNSAAAELRGKNDFASFMSAGSKITDTVRNIWYIRAERDGDFVRVYAAADGFLYNMVRIITGTLLDIASGRITMSVKSIIEKKDRKYAGHTLPAHGLYLNNVYYNENGGL